MVSTELFRIYNDSNRNDLAFLRDRCTNIFLQAVWKKKDFFKEKKNIMRCLPIKNSYYMRTKIKSLLYLVSPRLYVYIHNKIVK